MIVFLKRHVPVLIFPLALVVLAALATDTGALRIEMTAFESNQLQVFTAGPGSGYSEQNSLRMATSAGRRVYTVPLKNCLLLEKIRVDLQEGHGEQPPRPIILHSIAYDFKWFYRERRFDQGLSGINFVQGVVPGADTDPAGMVVFTHTDPIVDFSMQMRPYWHQVLLPFVVVLLLHGLLSSSLVRGKRNRFRVDLEFQCQEKEEFSGFIDELQKNKLLRRLVRSSREGDGNRLLFEVDMQSADALYSALQSLKESKRITSLLIIADRSGESG